MEEGKKGAKENDKKWNKLLTVEREIRDYEKIVVTKDKIKQRIKQEAKVREREREREKGEKN